MFGLGGELAKEVAFFIYVLLLFCASPFCDVQWLVGFPFYKGVILNSLIFQNLDPLLPPKFLCVLPSSYFEKLKICPIILMLYRFHA